MVTRQTADLRVGELKTMCEAAGVSGLGWRAATNKWSVQRARGPVLVCDSERLAQTLELLAAEQVEARA